MRFDRRHVAAVQLRGRHQGPVVSVAELAGAGVKLISLATSLYQAAMSGLVNAAREVEDQRTFGYLDTTMATPEFNSYTSGIAPNAG